MKKKLLFPLLFTALSPAINFAQCGPLITCPSNITVPATTGQCGAIVTYTATAIDQCPSGTTTSYTQNFSGTHNWTLNTATGTNGAQPNSWEVNATEGGVTPPGCGVANNGNNTLHITCTSLFCGSLITGAVYNAAQNTNRRAESPAISSVGYSGLTLKFNFISLGDGLNDNASVLYNDGSGWQVLTASIKSTICGSGQGQWTAYTATLPASCDNNANLKIGINWTNNADNVGTDPSIAIDDVTITAPGGVGAGPTITYSPLSGSLFPVGSTVVTATATDALLATASCTFTVTVTDNQAPVISNCPSNINITANNASCTGIATWTAPSANDNCPSLLSLNSTHSSGSVFPLGTTAVTYTANDGNGNTSTCTFSVTVTNNLSANSVGTNALCNAGATGSAIANVSGGTANYTYNWLPSGGTAATASNLSANNYTCTITDANGCTTTTSVTITEPAAIASSQTVSICSGQTFTVGTSNYTSAGNYIDVLPAVNGCDSTVSTNLSVIPSPTVAITSTLNAIECQGSVDTISANGAANYLWSTGSTNDSLVIVHAGGVTQWIVTGTDANGCSDADTISITNVSMLTPVFFDLSPDTVCSIAGNIALGGGVPMGGSFSGNGVTGSNFNTFAAGIGTHPITYSVINANGCISSDSANMVVESCLGIENTTNKTSLSLIYPNPTNSNFIVENKFDGKIEIYSNLGELVLTEKTSAGKNTINFEKALNGMYLIKVFQNNEVNYFRIVKQN